MRRMTLATAMAVATIALAAAPVSATKPSGPKPPKTTMTKSKPPKPAKVSAPKPSKASAPKEAKAPKAPKAPKEMKATTKAAKARTPIMTTPVTTGTWTPTNPIAQKISTKPNQLAKLQSVLPPGTDLNLATLGFRNFGQLNAAVNNSINHNMPFADLKAAMTGFRLDGTPTGLAPVSLGQAKKQIIPTITPPPPDGGVLLRPAS